MAAPAELTGIRLVDTGLGNSLHEMDIAIGKTVDISVDAGEPTTRSTCHFNVRIGCGGEKKKKNGDGANRTAGVGQPVRQVCKYAL